MPSDIKAEFSAEMHIYIQEIPNLEPCIPEIAVSEFRRRLLPTFCFDCISYTDQDGVYTINGNTIRRCAIKTSRPLRTLVCEFFSTQLEYVKKIVTDTIAFTHQTLEIVPLSRFSIVRF